MKWEMASVSPADTLSIVRLSTGGQFALMLDIAGSLNPRNKCMKYFMLIIFYLEPVEQGHWPIRMAAWKTNPRSLPAWWGRPLAPEFECIPEDPGVEWDMDLWELGSGYLLMYGSASTVY